MIIKNKDIIIKYLIILLPITLVLSIFLAELFLLIITVFFIKFYIKEKKSIKIFYSFFYLYMFHIFRLVQSLLIKDLILKVIFFILGFYYIFSQYFII